MHSMRTYRMWTNKEGYALGRTQHPTTHNMMRNLFAKPEKRCLFYGVFASISFPSPFFLFRHEKGL